MMTACAWVASGRRATGDHAMQAYGAAPGWRRLLAFGLDYLVIAAYIATLTAASFAVRQFLQLSIGSPTTLRERLLGHAIAFFSLMEASVHQATVGKRALGLRVVTTQGGRVPVGRALLRSALKFAPWELAHTALWHTPGVFTATAAPTPINWVGYGLSVVGAGWYIVSLFVGSRRTPYDRAAGTRVVCVRH
jgi:uncharacterized RDD family membrane protein YckC